MACAARLSLTSIMELMRMNTWLDEHIDGSRSNFNEIKDRLDEHTGECCASFKEIKDQLDDIHGCLSPTLNFPLFGVTWSVFMVLQIVDCPFHRCFCLGWCLNAFYGWLVFWMLYGYFKWMLTCFNTFDLILSAFIPTCLLFNLYDA